MRKQNKEDIVSIVLDDFKKRQYERKSFEIQWQLNMNFLMGNQFCNIGYGGEIEENDKQYFWQEREIFNHISPIIDIRLAKLSKIKPRMRVVPASNNEIDVKSAKLSQKILNSLNNKLNLNSKINQAIKWSEVCGTSFYKVLWNNDVGQAIAKDENNEKIRIGEVEISVCSPFEIFPDNVSCESLDEVKSLIHARAYSTDEIFDMYGIEVEGKDVNVFSLDNVSFGLGGLGYNGTCTKIANSQKKNSALVIERYEKPNKKFPNGRLVIIAGDKLVYDGDLPYINSNDGERTFPFVKQTCMDRTGCFWGESLVERLIPIQRAYNAVKNRKHEFLNRLSMGVLTVEDGSIDIENLEDEGLSPGKVLVYRQGATPPQYMDTESLPSAFTNEEESLLSEFQALSGISDLINTDKISSNMSGIALELMINENETRMNSTTESIRQAIKNVSQNILRLYKQFALVPRLTKIVGENGEMDLFFWSKNDLSSDDIEFEVDNEIGDSLTQKREMIFRLIDADILKDTDGKISNRTKLKLLEMLGFGIWENSTDLIELHTKKASNENLNLCKSEEVKVSEIDDHELHVNEHIAFMLSGEYEEKKKKNNDLEKRFLIHINQHKNFKNI
ncbi:MAG: hypothetical protein IJ008_02730 [Clostridia bacterium]|nr:hypothetical protein [Clostridia bacterium]